MGLVRVDDGVTCGMVFDRTASLPCTRNRHRHKQANIKKVRVILESVADLDGKKKNDSWTEAEIRPTTALKYGNRLHPYRLAYGCPSSGRFFYSGDKSRRTVSYPFPVMVLQKTKYAAISGG